MAHTVPLLVHTVVVFGGPVAATTVTSTSLVVGLRIR
jgi:hypothetical protein